MNLVYFFFYLQVNTSFYLINDPFKISYFDLSEVIRSFNFYVRVILYVKIRIKFIFINQRILIDLYLRRIKFFNKIFFLFSQINKISDSKLNSRNMRIIND